MTLKKLNSAIKKGKEAENILNMLVSLYNENKRKDLERICNSESKIWILKDFNEFKVQYVEERFEEDDVIGYLSYCHSTKKAIFYLDKGRYEITLCDTYDASKETIDNFISSVGSKYKRVISVLSFEYIWRIFNAELLYNKVQEQYSMSNFEDFANKNLKNIIKTQLNFDNSK